MKMKQILTTMKKEIENEVSTVTDQIVINIYLRQIRCSLGKSTEYGKTIGRIFVGRNHNIAR